MGPFRSNYNCVALLELFSKWYEIEATVQAMVAPFWEYVLEPLAEAGVYKGVFADIPMTRAAVYSERTAAVHLTGSLQTHDAILYGSGV